MASHGPPRFNDAIRIEFLDFSQPQPKPEAAVAAKNSNSVLTRAQRAAAKEALQQLHREALLLSKAAGFLSLDQARKARQNLIKFRMIPALGGAIGAILALVGLAGAYPFWLVWGSLQMAVGAVLLWWGKHLQAINAMPTCAAMLDLGERIRLEQVRLVGETKWENIETRLVFLRNELSSHRMAINPSWDDMQKARKMLEEDTLLELSVEDLTRSRIEVPTPPQTITRVATREEDEDEIETPRAIKRSAH